MGDTWCSQLAQGCGLFGVVGVFADIDLDGDGLNEAVSFGYEMDLAPAEIVDVETLTPIPGR